MQFADNAGPDQPARMQALINLTESMDTVVYFDEQRMLRSECSDAHTDLDLRYPHIASESFSCVGIK